MPRAKGVKTKALTCDLPIAVFQQALRDMRSKDPEIRGDAESFLSGGGAFEFWAMMAGCRNLDYLREKFVAHLLVGY